MEGESMSEWKELRAQDFCFHVTDGTHDSPKRTTKGYYLLTSKHIGKDTLNFESAYKISEDDYLKIIERSKVEQYDILYSMIGTIGNVHIVKEDKVNFAVKNMGIFKFNGDYLHSLWMYYWLKSTKATEYIKSRLSGSTQQYITLSSLRDFPISIPEIDIMRLITGILSSLDAKIETNNKLNEKLEEMAQAIFKSWFVDFEPFKDKPFHETELGIIPEGWKVVSLCDIANFTNGLAMQKYRPNDDEAYLPVLKIKELRQGFCDDTSEICTNDISEDYIAEDGDVIFSWSGTLLVDIWCGGECGVNQHLFKVTSEKYNKWFYYYWIKKHLEEFIRIAKDKTVTMGHIKREHLRNALVVVPDNKTMHNADKIFSPIINRIIESRIESKRLASLRDTLLPRLMSGELIV